MCSLLKTHESCCPHYTFDACGFEQRETTRVLYGPLINVFSTVLLLMCSLSELLPPLYIRFLRFRATRDYTPEAPFVVFEINYATGNPADNDDDAEEEEDPSPSVVLPVSRPRLQV